MGTALGQAWRVGHQGRGETGTCLRPGDPHLAHVREVEQADTLAHRAVLVENARVLDRHLPAREVDEPAAQRTVPLDERGPEQGGGFHQMPANASACSTSWRSVGNVSSVSASATGKNLTSSNS